MPGEGITSIGADAFNLIKGLFSTNVLKAYCVPDSYAASAASGQYLTCIPLTDSQFQKLFHINCPSSLELQLGDRHLISDRILLNRSIVGYRGIEVVSTNSEVARTRIAWPQRRGWAPPRWMQPLSGRPFAGPHPRAASR